MLNAQSTDQHWTAMARIPLAQAPLKVCHVQVQACTPLSRPSLTKSCCLSSKTKADKNYKNWIKTPNSFSSVLPRLDQWVLQALSLPTFKVMHFIAVYHLYKCLSNFHKPCTFGKCDSKLFISTLCLEFLFAPLDDAVENRTQPTSTPTNSD